MRSCFTPKQVQAMIDKAVAEVVAPLKARIAELEAEVAAEEEFLQLVEAAFQ